jgi:hypothetical protein
VRRHDRGGINASGGGVAGASGRSVCNPSVRRLDPSNFDQGTSTKDHDPESHSTSRQREFRANGRQGRPPTAKGRPRPLTET